MIIRNVNDLKKFLSESLNDAAQEEAKHQERLAAKLETLREDDETPADDAAPEASSDSKTVASETSGLGDKENVGVEDVISQLNALRSGKSLKDEVVKKNFVEYFDSLKKAERLALQTFLKGISQVLTGEVAGQAAISPHEPPVEVKMQKTKSITVKPTVVTKDAPTKPSQAQAKIVPPIQAKSK
jgi:hypothetical protein